jgi:glycerate kinase
MRTLPEVTQKILIAPDKFKGTLSATEAAKAIASGWQIARPDDELIQLPISDGGEGFGSLMAEALNGTETLTPMMDISGRKKMVPLWLTPEGTALIESANLIGLTLIPHPERNPLTVDSAGLGVAIESDKITDCRHCIIGVGGSATNDGGFGVARQLGWRFINQTGREIEKWPDLVSLQKITEPDRRDLRNSNLNSITVAVDVQNPLLGPKGCTRIYGPQKGLYEKDMARAEAALARLAEVWKSQTGENAAGLAGSGAAGGLGFGLHCFVGAKIRPGFEVFAEAVNLSAKLAIAGVVVTGEGAMDHQSIMGKGVGELAKLAQINDCRCLGLAGHFDQHCGLEAYFEKCHALTGITSRKQAEQNAAQWLEKLSTETAREFNETE